MNQAYQCHACRWKFSSPERETCVICGARALTKILPLARPWTDDDASSNGEASDDEVPDDVSYPEQPKRIYVCT